MKDQIWPAIYEIFCEVDKLVDKSRGIFSVKDNVEKRGMQVLKRGIQNEDIIPLRAEIRNKLNFLKAKMAENLNDREAYLVIFPIVIYFDEMVQSKIFESQHIVWPPLQKELFQIDNGGEVFYETIDDILRKPETIPLVYQVFYFCLSDGFRGQHSENVSKIEEYKNKLRAKIPLAKIENQEKVEEVPDLMRSENFPFWSYIATVVLLGAIYALLCVFAVI